MESRKCRAIVILGLLCCALLANRTLGSETRKRSKSDKDISSIGQRWLLNNKQSFGNWYSLDREKDIGKQQSATVEERYKLVNDRLLLDYISSIATKVANNSDTQLPITIRVIECDEFRAFTLPGGYQYISSGLLLHLESEGELASLLARGIAHTALRTTTRLMTRAQWAGIGSVPLIFVGSGPSSSSPGLAAPLTVLSLERSFESDADYFGVQYVYKAGYDPATFISLVERVWPSSSRSPKAFSAFSPTPERVRLLCEEIAEILPKHDGWVTSTPDFEKFKARLAEWKEAQGRN